MHSCARIVLVVDWTILRICSGWFTRHHESDSGTHRRSVIAAALACCYLLKGAPRSDAVGSHCSIERSPCCFLIWVLCACLGRRQLGNTKVFIWLHKHRQQPCLEWLLCLYSPTVPSLLCYGLCAYSNGLSPTPGSCAILLLRSPIHSEVATAASSAYYTTCRQESARLQNWSLLSPLFGHVTQRFQQHLLRVTQLHHWEGHPEYLQMPTGCPWPASWSCSPDPS